MLTIGERGQSMAAFAHRPRRDRCFAQHTVASGVFSGVAVATSREPYADAEQVASYLGVHLRSVRRLTASGILPSYSVLNRRLFRLSEIDRLVQAGRGGQGRIGTHTPRAST